MKVVAIMNQKGGVGKTTTALNVGAGLHRVGKRVLLVDLDPQANLTIALGYKPEELEGKSVYELFKGDASLGDVILNRDGLYVIPSTLDLSGAELEIQEAGREMILREILGNIDAHEMDYVLIDCPPSLGLLTINALSASDEVYVPLQTEYFALKGTAKLLHTVEIVKRRINPNVRVSGIIGTLYDTRKNLNKEIIEKIRAHFGDIVFKTLIRDNVALAESPSFGQTIFEYAPKAAGAEDYAALVDEIRERG